MDFIGEQISPFDFGREGKKDSMMLELNQVEGSGEDCAMGSGTGEEFPELNKEILKSAKEKERNRGSWEKEGIKGPNFLFRGILEKSKVGKKGTQGTRIEGNKGSGSMNYKESLADGGFTRGNLSVSFEPEMIRKMGVAGESSGLPSILFSGVESSFLAEKIGYTVVGKFSHSILSSLHLQRAFMGMKFLGEFSWKYINAKHVLVQFHLIDDYAKLLSGPNGMPVWFIDRHPMRVFKWTPDFDPFF